jgi:hypothetical protein
VEQATLLGHIPRNDQANGPLNSTKLSSHLCIDGVRHVYASFSESFWHQDVLFCFDDVPHMKDGVPGLQPTIWLSLLVAAELGFVEEGEAASCFFLLCDGAVSLSAEAVEGFIKNTLNLSVVHSHSPSLGKPLPIHTGAQRGGCSEFLYAKQHVILR